MKLQTGTVVIDGTVDFISAGNTALLNNVTLSNITVYPYRPDSPLNDLDPLGTIDSVQISVPSNVARYYRNGDTEVLIVQVVDRGAYAAFESQPRLRAEETLAACVDSFRTLQQALEKGGPAEIQRASASTIHEKLGYLHRQSRFLPYVGRDLTIAQIRAKTLSLQNALSTLQQDYPSVFEAPSTPEAINSALRAQHSPRKTLAVALADHREQSDEPFYVVGEASVQSITPASRGSWKVVLSDATFKRRDENLLYTASEFLCDLDRIIVFVDNSQSLADLCIADYLPSWNDNSAAKFPFTARVEHRSTPSGDIDIALTFKKAIDSEAIANDLSDLLDQWESFLAYGLEGTAKIHKKIRKRLDALDRYDFVDTHKCLRPNYDKQLDRYEELRAQVDHLMSISY